MTKTGTVGAAVTSIGIALFSASYPEKIIIDRPFLFFVREVQLNAIVFAGKVTNPSN